MKGTAGPYRANAPTLYSSSSFNGVWRMAGLQRTPFCFTNHEVFKLEVPEASFSLSTPSPHLFRLLPLHSADDLRSSRLMESSAHVRAHAHTQSTNSAHMDSEERMGDVLGLLSISPLFHIDFSQFFMYFDAVQTWSLTWAVRNELGSQFNVLLLFG